MDLPDLRAVAVQKVPRVETTLTFNMQTSPDESKAHGDGELLASAMGVLPDHRGGHLNTRYHFHGHTAITIQPLPSARNQGV